MKKLTLALALCFVTACGSNQDSAPQSQNAAASNNIVLSPAESAVVINILSTENVASEYLPGPVANVQTLWMVKSLTCSIGRIELTSPQGATLIERNNCDGFTFYDNKVSISGDNAKTLALTLAKAGVKLKQLFGLDIKHLEVAPLICTYQKKPEANAVQHSCYLTPASN